MDDLLDLEPVTVLALLRVGPFPAGEAIKVAREVAERARVVEGEGLTVSVAPAEIRLDPLGGVRCTPAPLAGKPTVGVGKLLVQMLVGDVEITDPEEILELGPREVAAQAQSDPNLSLAGLVALLDEALGLFEKVNLAGLVSRRMRAARVAQDRPTKSETAFWTLPDPTPAVAPPRTPAPLPTGVGTVNPPLEVVDEPPEVAPVEPPRKAKDTFYVPPPPVTGVAVAQPPEALPQGGAPIWLWLGGGLAALIGALGAALWLTT